MTINLSINNSEDNKLNKNITSVATLTGTLRNDTSIITPTILIEGTLLPSVNYMTIPDFGRSYFITNIRTIRNELYEISGRCDVLSSFANELSQCVGIVRKQENNWNLYLDDGTFRVYQNPNIITKSFPSGFSNLSFVLAVAGS